MFKRKHSNSKPADKMDTDGENGNLSHMQQGECHTGDLLYSVHLVLLCFTETRPKKG